MDNKLVSRNIVARDQRDEADDQVILDYDARFLRRKMLSTRQGRDFLVDLAHTTSLNHGDAFELTDGQLIEVVAAQEDVLEVKGAEIHRLAWHIGNRHAPCQIEPARLLIQHDPVLRDMLTRLGATLRDVSEPFTPEGGAYGHGRTHGHDHSHSHNQSHNHSYSHDPDQG